MANEKLFTKKAESYSKGRLGYAPEVMELICRDLLKPGDKIADVGSGTGIFAKEFIERGFDVYCVEPNEDMHKQAEAQFAGNPHFISVAASAEATGLADHSVDLVTAASAFHWFDAEKFRKECCRILKKNGIFLAVGNARDYEDPFTLQQHAVCEKLCTNFSSLRHGLDKAAPILEQFFGADLHHTEFDFPLEYTKEKFVQRSLSSSYAPKPGEEAYQEYIRQLWALLDEFAPGSDKIIVPNVSVVYWGSVKERE